MLVSGSMTGNEIDNISINKLYFGNLPRGNKFPLYGICRNDISESVANSHICRNIRYAIQLISISMWIKNSIGIVKLCINKIHEEN